MVEAEALMVLMQHNKHITNSTGGGRKKKRNKRCMEFVGCVPVKVK
jgi:hypothetical protein